MISVHGRVVAGLAGEIALSLELPAEERLFIEEAALLHDIGVCRVRAPEIDLHGEHPYIMHGVLGRKILEEEGLFRHAMVCERHIGVGLTEADILTQKLPLPLRDMQPVSTVEQIICFADLFFSKKMGHLESRKSTGQVRLTLSKFGETKLEIFDEWLKCFGAVL